MNQTDPKSSSDEEGAEYGAGDDRMCSTHCVVGERIKSNPRETREVTNKNAGRDRES